MRQVSDPSSIIESFQKNQYLMLEILSHLDPGALLDLLSKGNKQFAYLILQTLFKKEDAVACEFQQRLLRSIFLFPKKNVLTILKNWNADKYKKLIAFITDKIDDLPPDSDFEWYNFLRYAEGVFLTEIQFNALIDKEISPSRHLPLFTSNQMDVLFEKLIASIEADTKSAATYRTLNLLLPSLLSIEHCIRLAIALTKTPFSSDISAFTVRLHTTRILLKKLPPQISLKLIISMIETLVGDDYTLYFTTLKAIEELLLDGSITQLPQFLTVLIEKFNAEEKWVGVRALKALTEIICYFPESICQVLVQPIFNTLNTNNLAVCEGAFKAMQALLPKLSEKGIQQLTDTIIQALNSSDQNIFYCGLNSLLLLCPRLLGKQLNALMDSVIRIFAFSNQDAHDAMFIAMTRIIPSWSQEICEQFIDQVSIAVVTYDQEACDKILNTVRKLFSNLPQNMPLFLINLPLKASKLISSSSQSSESKKNSFSQPQNKILTKFYFYPAKKEENFEENESPLGLKISLGAKAPS